MGCCTQVFVFHDKSLLGINELMNFKYWNVTSYRVKTEVLSICRPLYDVAPIFNFCEFVTTSLKFIKLYQCFDYFFFFFSGSRDLREQPRPAAPTSRTFAEHHVGASFGRKVGQRKIALDYLISSCNSCQLHCNTV